MDISSQRMDALRAQDPTLAIRATGLGRILRPGLWRQGELVAWLVANVEPIEPPRWTGDCLGDRGAYRLGHVLEALELALDRDDPLPWLREPASPFPPAAAAAVR